MTQAGESLGVVDLDGWVALGDQKPRESVHDGARLLGSYSEAERSLRERPLSESDGASPRYEHREVAYEPRGGSAQPMRR